MSQGVGGTTPVSVAAPPPGQEPTVRVVPMPSPSAPREPAQSLSQLRIAYDELARQYERAKTEQDALIKKRENTERLLDRERMSAEARYGIITPPTPAKASMAKLFVSEAAYRCADRAVQVFGGRGYMRTNVAERFLRELRVDRIWEGTSEIQRLIVARALERRGVERTLH